MPIAHSFSGAATVGVVGVQAHPKIQVGVSDTPQFWSTLWLVKF